ncbi:Antitoxin component YwqK of the YwqJK toxin-antitoxin module [Paenimyroides aquimaris]|uniref:Antitoxin component YwqK of the YwqJK toxin-antitoxin module n=1 Tax=Paenimyroides marinum TaxID=1159016 RepID=A0A1H6KNX3_9FLAO|nr:toxin-antitoxin system YwqK family antitoxin [Paenimyroides aquimaris]SEH77139.1 Antitoxin component YwqK of the YwqJK toxin-antitoxin module [Paenimyroides aquimaris]
MKQYILTSLTVLASVVAVYAQDVNKTNAQGEREGTWIGYYPNTNYVKYEGTFKNGKETGTFKFYADEPEKKLVATKEFKADGSVYAVFFNGKKKMSEGVYVNKQKEGIWKTYHFDGQSVMAEEPYTNDKVHGIKKIYYPSGKLSEEIEYKNGIEDGISNQYAENGVKIKETQHKNGILEGKIIIRDETGKITDEAKYVNGKLIVPKKDKK